MTEPPSPGMTVPDPVATTSPHRQSQTRRRTTDGGDGVGPSRQRRNLLPMSRRVRSSTTHWSSVTRSAIRNLATVGRAILRRASEGAEADLVGGTRMSVALGDAAALVENVLRCQPSRDRAHQPTESGPSVILAVRQSVRSGATSAVVQPCACCIGGGSMCLQAEAAQRHQETAGNR